MYVGCCRVVKNDGGRHCQLYPLLYNLGRSNSSSNNLKTPMEGPSFQLSSSACDSFHRFIRRSFQLRLNDMNLKHEVKLVHTSLKQPLVNFFRQDHIQVAASRLSELGYDGLRLTRNSGHPSSQIPEGRDIFQ